LGIYENEAQLESHGWIIVDPSQLETELNVTSPLIHTKNLDLVGTEYLVLEDKPTQDELATVVSEDSKPDDFYTKATKGILTVSLCTLVCLIVWWADR